MLEVWQYNTANYLRFHLTGGYYGPLTLDNVHTYLKDRCMTTVLRLRPSVFAGKLWVP